MGQARPSRSIPFDSLFRPACRTGSASRCRSRSRLHLRRASKSSSPSGERTPRGLKAMATEQVVLNALRVVKDPDLHQDIVSLGFVKNLRIDSDRVAFTIELTTPACPVKDQMRDQARAAVMAVPGVSAVTVEMTATVRAVSSPEAGRAPVEGVKNIVAIGAGKGGV